MGPVTAAKMNRLGIHTGLDLRAQPLAFLAEHFGKAADYYYGVARGQDERPVEADRVRKSVGAENNLRDRPDTVGAGRPGAGAGVRQGMGGLWSRRSCRGYAIERAG